MSAGDGGARALVERYAQSIRLHPESAGDLYSDLGSKLSAIGNRRAAANAYYHAISLVPTHAVAYNNLAALLLGSSRRSEALDFFLTAHALQPEQYTRYPQMHLNLAGSLVDAGRYSEAIWHYGRGLAYPPNEEDTLGRILHLSQRVCDWRAVDRFWSRAYQALVTRTVRVGHRRASGERPALSPMHALTLPLSAQELFALSVAHASAIEADVAARRFGYRHPLVPLPLQPAAEEDRLATSVEVAARGEGRATRDRGGGLVRQRARLHVGWISADFKRHPVTILLAPALAAMRASCVDLRLSAFPLNPIGVEPAGAWADASAQSGRGGGGVTRSARGEADGGAAVEEEEGSWQARLLGAVHASHPLVNLTDESAAKQIHAAAPHILVDLHGLFSRGARPHILAARPAPIQATHLGYGASTGARFLDYVFADRYSLPASYEHAATFSERFALLPPAHLPSGHASLYPFMRKEGGGDTCCPECASAGSTGDGGGGDEGGGGRSVRRARCLLDCRDRSRRRYGLPPSSGRRGGGVVYAYLGQHVKVDELTFQRWLALLLATPRSVLWLLRWPSSSAALQAEAAALGIDPRRLVFAEREPQGTHLCAFGLADLSLDSPLYASGATGIDVLWSGVPMLAMAGGMRTRGANSAGESTAAASTIFQRNGVSLLGASALPEATSYSSAGYVQLGVSLAEGRRTRHISVRGGGPSENG